MIDACRERGFTLIEILVTLVIVSIILSIAVMSLNLVSDDREIRTEVRRLMSLLEVAQDDAVLQGRDFGIEFLLGGYRFVEYDAYTGQWHDIFAADVLRPRKIPDEMEISLYLEDKRVLLDKNALGLGEEDQANSTAEIKNYAPHLLIFSSGDMTPFEVSIRRETDQLAVALKGDLFGNIEFIDDEDMQR